MLKGIERSMVVLKNTGSPLYEEAYFILKKDSAGKKHAEMVSECNRIIESCLIRDGKMSKPRMGGRLRYCLTFFLGLACGALVMWLLLL